MRSSSSRLSDARPEPESTIPLCVQHVTVDGVPVTVDRCACDEGDADEGNADLHDAGDCVGGPLCD